MTTNPYSPPDARTSEHLPAPIRLRRFLIAFSTSVAMPSAIIVALFVLFVGEVPMLAYLGMAILILPFAAITATASALLTRLPLVVAAIGSAVITTVAAVAIAYFIGSQA